MKRSVSISFILLLLLQFAYGQDKPISEFDLYGCWMLEEHNSNTKEEKLIYTRCKYSDSTLAIEEMKISLLAFDKCEFQSYNYSVLGRYTTAEYGTWTYDEESQMVTIYEGHELLKALKEKEPELFEKYGLPKKQEWMTFKVVGLAKNQMEVE